VKPSDLPLPKSRLLRILSGVLLIILGIFGFLPILGFWMIPLGLVVLSADIPAARRLRRRMALAWERRFGSRKS
jgi:hypothetical protein